ncbi:MAG: cupin domain-containing protein [Alkalibacterium sp.]|nr:cupin domain-containing protein [Alkalibacterium sp.]
MKPAHQWINELKLEPHPEGGYYRQTDLSKETYQSSTKELPLYTTIYFLLTPDSPSHFHQLSSDEIWFYHAGQALTVHSLHPNGHYETTKLGLDISKGHMLHHTVPAGTIFGSTVDVDYALVSCTVVPGFDFSDFKLFTQSDLLQRYPQHEPIIKKLAYDTLPE